MSDDLKFRIQQRLGDLGLTSEGASKKAGLSRDFLRQLFLRTSGNPRAENLLKIAEALETTPNWLLTGIAEANQDLPTPDKRKIGKLRGDFSTVGDLHLNKEVMPSDVPVMGTAAASVEGGFQFEGGIIDYVRRPPALNTAKDVYAIYIEGSSMEPEHRPGDLRFVHPHRPPRVGDSVVVQVQNGRDEYIQAFIGHLARRTSDFIIIGKLNPFQELKIDRVTVISLHKVLNMNELFGV